MKAQDKTVLHISSRGCQRCDLISWKVGGLCKNGNIKYSTEVFTVNWYECGPMELQVMEHTDNIWSIASGINYSISKSKEQNTLQLKWLTLDYGKNNKNELKSFLCERAWCVSVCVSPQFLFPPDLTVLPSQCCPSLAAPSQFCLFPPLLCLCVLSTKQLLCSACRRPNSD